MMLMRTILAICLAAFALAAPVSQPRADSLGGGVGVLCFSKYALYQPNLFIVDELLNAVVSALDQLSGGPPL